MEQYVPFPLVRQEFAQAKQSVRRQLSWPTGHPNCRRTAIKAWLESADITGGPLFRPVNRWSQIAERSMTPGAVNDIVKSLGSSCGLDFVPDLSSHSFRRGLSTSAARERVEFELIKKQGGWKSDATVREYIEEGQQMRENASTILMGQLEKILANRQDG